MEPQQLADKFEEMRLKYLDGRFKEAREMARSLLEEKSLLNHHQVGLANFTATYCDRYMAIQEETET